MADARRVVGTTVRCSSCRKYWNSVHLEDGVCPDCRAKKRPRPSRRQVASGGPRSGQVQYWLKPQGVPDVPVDEAERFAEDRYRIGFAKAPRGIEVGDVLIVYRIGISAILYAGEAVEPWREATADEIRQEPWRERWRWVVEVQNLTPDFGREWAKRGLKPFTLAREYEALNPTDPQSLGTINFGNDKALLSQRFARHLLALMG